MVTAKGCMIAPISVCIITRDDPHLEACLQSFRAYVEEVCVVITSSNDIISRPICEKYNCKVEVFDACNEDDKIVDFSLARNKSFSMATQPWLMWIDSDDILAGGEKLSAITSAMKPDADGIALLFPYEYAYTNTGAISCKHYRERLISNRDSFHFIGPVHEVLIPKEGKNCQLIQCDDILFKHQRQYTEKAVETGRNLRILKKYIEKVPDDARQMYYIGLEYGNNGDVENCLKYLTKYIDVSGWDDERVMACIKLVEVYGTDYKKALKYALKAVELKPEWFESYYIVAKCFYFLNKWQSCIDFSQLALSKGKTETLLFVNEAARADIHSYLNVAYNAVGETQKAYESCLAGLAGNPEDTNLLHNKQTYEAVLKVSVKLPETDLNCLQIVFCAGPGCEAWSPLTAAERGVGGSETMLIHQAKNLAALGHKVRVYAEADGIFDGVEYLHWSKYKNISCDILIVSRNAQFLDANFNVAGHLKVLWLHDVCAIGATSALLLRADYIYCLSEWHKQNVLAVHNVHPEKVIVTRNGIDLSRFNKKVERNPLKCINSSSPDRSWMELLECWQDIHKQVPGSELHLYYGFLNWKAAAQHDPNQMQAIHTLEKLVKETPGVFFHDRVPQDELAEAFLSSQAWLYFTGFTETSCISAMEAQAAGCHIITTPVAALKETCGGYDKTTFVTNKKDFIQETVKVLQDGLQHKDISGRMERTIQRTSAEEEGKSSHAISTKPRLYQANETTS